MAPAGETNVKVEGSRKYLYRADGKAGTTTVKFLPTAKPLYKAALRFLHNAIAQHEESEHIMIGKSGAGTVTLRRRPS
ncbi:MAG: hypothetical protein C3F11_01115, partial [Methylocystaceae bacterium]